MLLALKVRKRAAALLSLRERTEPLNVPSLIPAIAALLFQLASRRTLHSSLKTRSRLATLDANFAAFKAKAFV